MKAVRRVLTATLFIASIGVMPGLAGASADDGGDQAADVNFLLELKPGENPEVHVDWLLGKLGVSANEREERIVPVHDDSPFFKYSFTGAWLRLTPAEATEAGTLTHEGILNGQRAFDVSVPVNPFGAPGESGITGTAMTGGGQTVPTGYKRVGASPGDYSDVDVAVLDTGVDSFHSDLNVVNGFDCTYEGRVGLRPADSWRRDGYGHGTHVAGIIGALDNDRGVVGNAPGARIWSIPVLGDDGSGSMASLACGIEQVARQATTIDVYNMSLGGGNEPSECWSWDTLHNAICAVHDLGVTGVVSAGNSSMDAITSSPANYAESVLTVSALTDFDGLPGGLAPPPDGIPAEYVDDGRALFSNYGAVVDLIAPGVQILSTTPNDTVAHAHGTSMAAPEVSGVVAAWISQNPRQREHAAEAVLAFSADQWGADNAWTGDIGPDLEPIVAFGAPEWAPEGGAE